MSPRQAAPLPPIEEAWRMFRRHFGAHLRDAIRRRPKYVRELAAARSLAPAVVRGAFASVFDEVPLTTGEASEYAREMAALDVQPFATWARADERLDFQEHASTWGAMATMWAAYRRHKRIYRVGPHLASGLARAKWPGPYPLRALTLPMPGSVLEVPSIAAAPTTVVSWDWWGRLSDPIGGRHLAVTTLEAPQRQSVANVATYLASDPLHLTSRRGRHDPLPAVPVASTGLVSWEPAPRDTLDAAFARTVAVLRDRAVAYGLIEAEAIDASIAASADDLRLLINVLLYIQADEDVVGRAQTAAYRRLRASEELTERGWRERDLAEPATYDVGIKYGAAIDHWLARESAEPREPGHETGRVVRPHLRAAHSHLYWTGPGRQEPRVHFLPPIPVKGGVSDVYEAPVPTVRVVK